MFVFNVQLQTIFRFSFIRALVAMELLPHMVGINMVLEITILLPNIITEKALERFNHVFLLTMLH